MNQRASSVVVLVLFSLLHGSADAQQSKPSPTPVATSDAPDAKPYDLSNSDSWMGGRYRLTPTDVIELTFPFVSEFNQTVTVQPDGYVTLQGIGELRVQGRSIPELRQMLLEAYEPILREPAITIVLKDFEKPYFVAAGEVKTPGKFDLRGATSVTQALAVAGGLTEVGKSSQVILFRRYADDLLEVKEIDLKRMLDAKDLSEDPLLRPGDTLYVPKSRLAQLGRFIARPQLGMYLNPFQF